jgi:hypothetical protein
MCSGRHGGQSSLVRVRTWLSATIRFPIIACEAIFDTYLLHGSRSNGKASLSFKHTFKLSLIHILCIVAMTSLEKGQKSLGWTLGIASLDERSGQQCEVTGVLPSEETRGTRTRPH